MSVVQDKVHAVAFLSPLDATPACRLGVVARDFTLPTRLYTLLAARLEFSRDRSLLHRLGDDRSAGVVNVCSCCELEL